MINSEDIVQLKKQLGDIENRLGSMVKPKFTLLPSNASNSDIINKINELILFLNNKLR